ncbi:MAG TPA: branched-chain amino acid ABC transporter substrate-binding protein [Acidimicrobiales bacterium]|nr:branched-chain amino acid ABC transporter substrate-binding protein [Acidimicrobiales bacterium]
MYKSLPKRAVAVAAAVAASALSLGATAAPATAASKPTFTIAFEGPLSGGNQQLGENVEYAVELAVDQANAGTTFGNLPFTLKWLAKDDQGSATISPTDAQELVSNPSVIAVVGPMFSGATKAAEPTFSAHNLATVSPSATNPALATSGWHNFFRDVAGDNIQGPTDANYVVKTMHDTNLMVVSDASTYGAGLADAFAAQAKADGAKVTTGTFPGTSQCSDGTASPTQYPDDAATVVSAKPQLLFYGGYYCDLGLLLGALHKAGYTGKVMSGDGSESNALVSGTNPPSAANGVYASCPCAVVGSTPTDKAFSAGFTKLAHFAPAIYSPEGYDATNVIIDAMKILASGKSGTMAIDRVNLVNQLHKTSYAGITKTVSFLSNGNINGSDIYVYRVENGKFVQLGLE